MDFFFTAYGLHKKKTSQLILGKTHQLLYSVRLIQAAFFSFFFFSVYSSAIIFLVSWLCFFVSLFLCFLGCFFLGIVDFFFSYFFFQCCCILISRFFFSIFSSVFLFFVFRSAVSPASSNNRVHNFMVDLSTGKTLSPSVSEPRQLFSFWQTSCFHPKLHSVDGKHDCIALLHGRKTPPENRDKGKVQKRSHQSHRARGPVNVLSYPTT